LEEDVEVKTSDYEAALELVSLLEASSTSIQAQHDALVVSRDALVSSHATVEEQHIVELARLEKTVEEKNVEVLAALDRIAILESSSTSSNQELLDANVAISAELVVAKDQLAETTRQMDLAHSEAVSLRETVSASTSRIESLQGAIVEGSVQLAESAAQLSTLQASFDEQIVSNENVKTELVASVEQLTSEVARLSQESHGYTAAIATLEEEVSTKEARIAEVSVSLPCPRACR
jgi:chromosome segregation ATPase